MTLDTAPTAPSTPAGSAPPATPAAPATPAIRPIPDRATPGSGTSPSTSAPAASGAPDQGASPAGTGEGSTSAQPAGELEHNSSTRDPKTGRYLSKPALPGVGPARHVKQDARRSKNASGTPADGTVPPPGTTPADSASAPQAVDPNAPPKPTGGPFRFAGQEFETQEKAEQNFRTLQGLHRSLTTRLDTADRENQANHYSASQWKQRAEQLEAELNALGNGRPSGTANGPVDAGGDGTPQALTGLPESADDIFKGVDLGLVEEIANTEGPLPAAFHMVRESFGRLLEGVRAEIASAREPFINFQRNMYATTAVRDLIENMAAVERPDASGANVPAYPELNDPQARDAIATIWQRLGFNDEQMLTQGALLTAILHYRNMVGMAGVSGIPGAPASAGPVASPSTAPANGAAAAAAAITAALTGGGQGAEGLSGVNLPAVRPANGAPESHADRIRREVREAPVPDPTLGFVRRKAARA